MNMTNGRAAGRRLYGAFARGEAPDPSDLDRCLEGLERLLLVRYPSIGAEAVREMASDTITTLFEAARTDGRVDEPWAWMRAVARNIAYDHWRAQQRTRPSADPVGELALPSDAEDGILSLIDALHDKLLVRRAIRAALAADDTTVVRTIVAWLDLYEVTGELPTIRAVGARADVPSSTVAKALERFAGYLQQAADAT